MSAKNLGISGVLFTDRRNFYLDPQSYAELYPVVTPFISILQAKGVKMTPDADFKMFEHRAPWRYQHISVNAASPGSWSATTPGGTITVAVDGAIGVTVDASLIGHEVEIYNSAKTTYKGNALVTAISGSDVTLKALGNSGVSNFAMSALADDDILYVVGDARGEGTDAPEASSSEMEVVYNSCQEMKTTVEITKALQKAALRGHSDELQRLRELKAQEHKIKMARAFYWGMRTTGIGGTAHGAGGGADSTFINHITDADGKTVRKTMGFFSALRRYGRTSGDQQNVFTETFAAFDYDALVDRSEKLFQYMPNDGVLTALCGPGNMSFWSKIGASGLLNDSASIQANVNISGTKSSNFGLNYREVETPHGLIRLIPEPLFRSTPYHNDMLIVNTDNVDMVQFESDEYSTNIKTDNNPRIIKDEYYSNLGLGLKLMESHSWFKFS